jgi:hypothetical protein
MFYKDILNYNNLELVNFQTLKDDAKIVARMEVLVNQAKGIRIKKKAYKALSLNNKINNKLPYHIIIRDLNLYKKLCADEKYFDDFIISNLCNFTKAGQYIRYFE